MGIFSKSLIVWISLGFNPAESNLFLTAVEKSKPKLTGVSGGKDDLQERIEAVKAELTAKHEKEIAAERKLRETREAQLQKELLENTALRHLPAGTKIPLVLPHIRTHVRAILDERTGDYVAKVFESPDAPRPRLTLQQGKTNDMDVEEFIALLRKDEMFGPVFPGHNAAGGGARGSGGIASGGTPQASDGTLTPQQRLARGFAKGKTGG